MFDYYRQLLKEADQGTVQYMIEEQKKELDKVKQEIAEKNQEIAEERKKNAELEARLKELMDK